MVFCFMDELICIAVNLHIIKEDNMQERLQIIRLLKSTSFTGRFRRGYE